MLAANDRLVPVIATAGQTIFFTDFRVDQVSDLEVWRRRAGAVALLVNGADYDVTLLGEASGCQVQLMAASLAGDEIVLAGVRLLGDSADFQLAGIFRSQDINGELDRLLMMVQELRRDVNRSVRLGITDNPASDLTLPAVRAGRYLAFDGSGVPVTVPPPQGRPLNPRGGWALGETYFPDDLVYDFSATYVAIALHTAAAATRPGSGASWTTVWAAFAPGALTPRGNWAAAQIYGPGDLVAIGGFSYVARATHTSSAATEPGTGASWQTVWQVLISASAAVTMVFSRTGAIVAQAGDYLASQITNVPAGGIAAATVQAALNELDSEKFDKTGGTISGNVIISGNVTINGTTTTVNSTETTYGDIILTIGGDTAPGADDGKDRGLLFRWHDGSAAKLGYFGFDRSSQRFVFIPDATDTASVISGAVGTIEANLQGNASTASAWQTGRTLTASGDVSGATAAFTGSGNITIGLTIGANAVTNAKAAQMPASTFKGNPTGGTADQQDMTAAVATSLLNTFTNALKGLVPASGGGTTTYLRADGSFAAPQWGGIGGTLASQTDLQAALDAKLAASLVSSFALTLLDDTSAATMRTTLGLGSLATQSGTFSGSSSNTNTGDQVITLTGDVTGSGGGSFAATIAANAVTYGKMQDISATNRLLGRITAGAGDPEELSGTQATTIMVVFVGDTGSGGAKGLVPAPATGDAGKFLKGDGTWGVPGGGSGIADGDYGEAIVSGGGTIINLDHPNVNFAKFVSAHRKAPVQSEDFAIAATGIQGPFNVVAVSTGTATVAPAAGVVDGNHPGVMLFRSSTTANSGIACTTSLDRRRIAGGEQFDIIFRTPASLANLTYRFGFQDTATSADAVDGVYFEMTGGTGNIIGKTSSNSTRSSTATIATLAVNTWYHARLSLNAAATQADFAVYGDAGVQQGSTLSLTANIPTASGREVGVVAVFTNSGTTAVDIVNLDYIAFGNPGRALQRGAAS
ncbi:MAG: hypothetical protein ACRCS9_13990 [Hyphomicrobium sp.]